MPPTNHLPPSICSPVPLASTRCTLLIFARPIFASGCSTELLQTVHVRKAHTWFSGRRQDGDCSGQRVYWSWVGQPQASHGQRPRPRRPRFVRQGDWRQNDRVQSGGGEVCFRISV